MINIISARAKAIGQKKSRMGAMIFEWWQSQDYPAVSPLDAKTREEVMAQFAEKKKRTA
jgi:hypothetical protein